MYGSGAGYSYGSGVAGMPADLPMYDYDGGKTKKRRPLWMRVLKSLFFSIKGLVLVTLVSLAIYCLILHTSNGVLKSQQNELTAEVAKLRKALDDTSTGLKSKETSFSSKEKMLEGELATSRNEVKAKEAETNKLRAQIEKTKGEHEAEKRKATDEKAALEGTIKKHLDEVASLRSKVEENSDGKHAGDREMKLLQEKVEELQHDLDAEKKLLDAERVLRKAAEDAAAKAAKGGGDSIEEEDAAKKKEAEESEEVTSSANDPLMPWHGQVEEVHEELELEHIAVDQPPAAEDGAAAGGGGEVSIQDE